MPVCFIFALTHPLSLLLPLQGNATAHMVRYASGPHTTVWPFWVDVPDGSSLHIELFVKHCEATPETEAVVASMPEWATTAAVTMWESGWEFGP